MRVLVFGDSITQGLWDINGGWVSRINRLYTEQTITTKNFELPVFINLGIAGDNSQDLLKRIDNEIIARSRNDELAIVIAIGFNDSRVKSGVNFSSPEEYINNLAEISTIVRKYTDKILFVGLTPCIESRTNPVAWGPTSYNNNRIRIFNNALQGYCNLNKIAFVDVFDVLTEALEKSDILPDGVHPNDNGHQTIAEIVGQSIIGLLGTN